MHQDVWGCAKSRNSNVKFAIQTQRLGHQTNVLDGGVAKSIFVFSDEKNWKQNRNQIKSRTKLSISFTHLISISLDLMSPIEFPINDICSSLTPDRLTLIHRNMGTDESSVCKNCGSTRCFLFRSNTDMPSILIWLIGDDFSAFEIALNVFVASSRWIIQLQIFNVFSNLVGGLEGGKFNRK